MYNSNLSADAPIVIGGVGGSGTRVISNILEQLHVYMGADLNKSADNLWFTLLFRRTKWYEDAIKQNPQRIHDTLDALTDLMIGTSRLDGKTQRIWRSAILDWLSGSNKRVAEYHIVVTWTLIRMYHLLRWSPLQVDPIIHWGWKEPNSHIYLPYLIEHFPNMRYVHVIRNGLDMAYSSNLNQFRLWGHLYGVDMPHDPLQVPSAALTYWIGANEKAVEIGETSMGNRFMLLNFDSLCLHPNESFDVLTSFLGLTIDAAKRAELISLIKVPKSIGRYREQDLSKFSEAQIEAVKRFGFDVTY